ncbi:hypothetical protein ACHAW6_012746 [Cyclotella cf. meneghiniana]
MVAKYSSKPRKEHGQAVIYIDLGLHFKPDPPKGFYCYDDANLSGEWNKDFAELDPSTQPNPGVVGLFCMPIVWSFGV